MRLSKLMAVCVLVLAAASIARADGIDPTVIFDPTYPIPGQLGIGPDAPYLITGSGPFTIPVWGDCTVALMYNPTAFAGAQGCAYFLNELMPPGPISDVYLSFTWMGPDSSAMNCVSGLGGDPYLTSALCPSTINNGDFVTVDFSGGTPVGYGMLFIIGEVGVPAGVSVGVPSYDPNTLVLLVVGMAMLGMFSMRRHARAF